MYRRSHRSWREPKTPFRSIGEVYLDSSMFSSDDEAAQTIGKAAVGPDAMTIIENRRKVKGRLNDFGAEQLKKVVEKVKGFFPDSEVKVTWDRYCDCSMCPCSPGYRIKVKTDRNYSSNGKNRFSLHLEAKEGKLEYTFFRPKDSFWVGYQKIEEMEAAFAGENKSEK